MGFYNTKIIDYGYKEKVIVYDRQIEYGEPQFDTGKRQKYQEMSAEKQSLSDQRRIRYYKKAVRELVEIAMMNPELDTAITLTFREPITSYDIALTAWQQFLKRLRHLYENPLKYLCVWEYQKQRSVKLNIENGGIFHFHCLMNIGYIEHSKLEKIWGKGFVWIDHLSSEHKKQNAILYTTKYCVKEIVSRIENKEDIRGQRFFFTSNNLLKPKVFTMQESANLENLIIKNLENMISDGQYSMCNECGIPVNAISYIEYKK